MEILYLFIGLVVGVVITFFILYTRKKNIEAQLMLVQQDLAHEKEQKQAIIDEQVATDNENHILTDTITSLKVELGQIRTQLESEKSQNAQELQMRREQFEQQLKTVQEQFSNLATKVLNQTSEQLKSSNTETFEHITKPLKQNIEQLHQAIQTTNTETAKNTASLSQQLRNMAEQTTKIDQTATRLTNVIRGGNKAQGNWGERMLAEMLDAQGLKVGIDYDVQQIITDDKGNVVTNDDTGKRMIPDVILHYPNNEDVVIDSKMSIDAYYQYVNTEEEELKKKYADALVKSIRTQMNNLARKDYSSYIKKPRKAIDFVIMFVPNEGALQLALATDTRIWGEAFEKQVFITSQQNLLAILKMIQIAWRQYAQTENQKKVFDIAAELLKRVGEFIKRFEKVGKDIESLHNDYNFAFEKAYNGRQSIVQKANELKTLGVKESPNQPIPETQPDILDYEDEKEK